MKPDDGVRGFMFDPDKPQGAVVPLNKEKFLNAYQSPKKGHESNSDRAKVKNCSKAFNDNHNTHLMITVYVNPDGEIRLLEGNRRFSLLCQGSEPIILANIINNNGYDDVGFADSINTLMEKCGEPDALIEQRGPVVFCNIEYGDNGHFAYLLTERITAPYYTIDKSAAPESKPT